MELKFSNNLDSAKRLDEIMNSYSGRDCGSTEEHGKKHNKRQDFPSRKIA